MATATVPGEKQTETITVSYEHPFVVRLAHWLNAVALLVMITSGCVFSALSPASARRFRRKTSPSFRLLESRLAAGLAGPAVALHLHVDLRWQRRVVCDYQIITGHWRQVLFMPRDIKGVWPMARHYFLFGKKPPVDAAYNPLQKLAYTSTIFFGVMSTLTGMVLFKPAQFWWLAWPLGGYHYARIWHFVAMCGFVAFIPGHLIMVPCTAGTTSTR